MTSAFEKLWGGVAPAANDRTNLEEEFSEGGVGSSSFDDLWGATPRRDPSPSIDNALTKNPDEVAKKREAARAVGLPEATAEFQDTSEIEKQARRAKVNEQLTDAPITSQTVADPRKAEVLIDDISSLTMLERISRGFRRGIATRELGQAGYEASLGDPVALERARGLSNTLKELGHDDEGFVSYLAATAKILGQQYSSFTDPDAAARIGAGGTIGASAGLAGGPFAPVTSAAGAVAGLTTGAVSHFVVDAFQTEAGHAYLEQIEEGIDPSIAKFSATAVGLLNAGLETAGAKILLAPLSEAKRAIVREGIRKFAATNAFKDIAKRAAGYWAAGVAGEVTTEVLQESVNIVATEVSKAFDKKDFETITPDEIVERLTGIAEETFKGTVLLAGGGSSVQFTTEIIQARKARQNAEETLQQISDTVKQSPGFKRDPEAVSEHVAEAVKQNSGVDHFYLPAEALLDMSTATDEGRQILADLGIENEVITAYEMGADVKITVKDFTQKIAGTEAFDVIRDQVRIGPDQMNAREAALIEENADPNKDVVLRHTNDPVELAEQEMGLKALFTDAKDVGMTQPAYESYLAAVQQASETGKRRQEAKRIKEEERKLTQEFAREREKALEDAREELAQQPVFEALNAIGRERLDRQMVEELLPDGAEQLADLPKSNNRAIVTQRGEKGIDPHVMADLYGFGAAENMLFAMMEAGNFEDAVSKRADAIVRERNPDMTVREKALEEARESLLNSSQAKVLEIELNAMREAEGQGKLSPKALRKAVRDHVRNMTLDKLEPTALLNAAKRAGREAGILLRKGERQSAAEAKLRQLKAFEAAKEAYRWRAQITKQRRYLKQFTNKNRNFPSLPITYLEQIREALDGISLGSRMTEQSKTKLREFAAKKLEQGEVFDAEGIIRARESQKNYQDMTLAEFTSLYTTIRSLQKAGQEENKMRRAEEQRTRDEIAADVVASMIDNVDPRIIPPATTRALDATKRYTRRLGLLLATPDTIVRELDGFADLGPVQQAIKAPYNKAYTEGYNEGQVGYAARQEKVAEDLTNLFSVFTAKEQANMRRPIRIPGLSADKKMSHGTLLSVLMNSGNAENKALLLNEFTDAELSAIYNFASKRDWDFAQSVWDYLDTYWSEVEAATVRRKNVRPERVQAEAIQTRYGEYAGGYFPIRYDSEKGAVRSETIEEVSLRVQMGDFVTSHTQDGHTKERQDGGGRKLLLDPYVVNSHVDQVIYDLEMGDAVNDIFKILNHDQVKKTFGDLGRADAHKTLNLWLQDAISGEMMLNGVIENGLRYLRSGFTTSKIGLNVGTMLLQPMGLLQTAATIGKRNTIRGIYGVMSHPLKSAQLASELSGLMRVREETFNKDILLTSQLLHSGGPIQNFLVGNAPEIANLPAGLKKSAQLLNASFFYGIKKMQRVVDLMTFFGALSRGMQQFDGDQAKAVEYAESMVTRSQASGIFGDRSAIERGTTEVSRQSEWVKAFTALASYFIAKNNVAYERTVSTGRKLKESGGIVKGAVKNPGEVLNYAIDMALLYTVEAVLVALLREGLPDPEDEEDSWAGLIATETAKSVIAGIPLLREAASEIQGFRGGGVFSSVLSEFGKAVEQWEQGEVDEAMVKSTVRLGGTIFRLPSSQPINTGTAISRSLDGEDMELMEFILGPRYEGPR